MMTAPCNKHHKPVTTAHMELAKQSPAVLNKALAYRQSDRPFSMLQVDKPPAVYAEHPRILSSSHARTPNAKQAVMSWL
ncbi:hypothetical protein J7T55_002036 [Diaporthe amygdali]|uniref:uncharacterized protein n=1 Tax=Phomopsis amygdali TaxID=1214568 RepID=UPI0022FDEE3D|nr:uncharacterized protein J7T55_002036 [Diaporthe amygdali]KAJ0108432.1 hypothetical protein J7T55_002036 [Diaporthe amygdali]